MRYRLEIRPDALADIEKAAEWYDKRELGLGNEFARDVLHAIDTLPLNPLLYRVRHRRANVRWKLVDTFPYRIVYQITDELITLPSFTPHVRNVTGENGYRSRLHLSLVGEHDDSDAQPLMAERRFFDHPCPFPQILLA